MGRQGHAVEVVMFTDLVGSTELRSRLGDREADALRRDHDAVLAAAVERHGGGVVKGLGDGVMATFVQAGDALEAAMEIQRGVDHLGARHVGVSGASLSVRVGISAGDVVWEDDDCFGTPVVEASRLCASAAGREILCAAPTRWLARGRSDLRFREAGARKLKGLADPVETLVLEWEATADGSELPPALVVPSRFPLLGRDAELAALDAAWSAAGRGEQRAALLAGEPGAGKTRLLAELGWRAIGHGALVVAGGCDADAAIPYQPFADGLHHLLRTEQVTDDELQVAGLARLLPERGVDAPGGDPESDRVRLFTAMVAWLADVARRRPVLVIVDDAHWATSPTLVLLKHLLRPAAVPGALIVIAYRDTDVDRRHPLATLLAELRRRGDVDRLTLGGLDDDSVEALAALAVGDGEHRALARALGQSSRGNPFFVTEVLDRSAVSPMGTDVVAIPESVREMVGQRLSALPESVDDLLHVAAVAGAEFDVAVVADATALATGEALDAVNAATHAGLVVEQTGRRGRYAFAHALVRQVLAEELATARQVRLHHDLALAIERRYGADPGPHLAELAHHFAEGALAGEPAKAVAYARRAAEAAAERLAFEDEADHYERALAVVSELGGAGAEERCDLSVALGVALRRAGVHRYEDVLYDAAAQARELGDWLRFARATTELFPGTASSRPRSNPRFAALLEEALAGLGDGDARLRALLLARLAIELSYEPNSRRRRGDLVDEALRLARQCGDPVTLHAALYASMRWGLDDQESHEAKCGELVALGHENGLPEAVLDGESQRMLHHLLRGERDAADASLERAGAALEQIHQPIYAFPFAMMRVGQALLDGDLPEADRRIAKAFEIGEASGRSPSTYLAVTGWLQFAVALERGTIAAMSGTLRAAADRRPDWLAPTAMYLNAGLAAGEVEDVRGRLDRLAPDRFRALAPEFHDPGWGVHVTDVARVVAAVGTREEAIALYGLLLPGQGQIPLGFGFRPGEPFDLALGRLARRAGDESSAIEHLRAALDLSNRLRAPGFRAHTELELATTLLEQGDPGDEPAALRLATAARATAEQLGFTVLRQDCDALLAQARG